VRAEHGSVQLKCVAARTSHSRSVPVKRVGTDPVGTRLMQKKHAYVFTNVLWPMGRY
jgi:hypothetical protein